jgi:hypothetical protein
MIMTIPYINKLNVLAKISPPFPSPGPGSPDVEIRGPVIATEGSNPQLLQAVGAVVEKTLTASSEISLQTWSDTPLLGGPRGQDSENGEETCRDRQGSLEALQNLLPAYLQLIMRWHEKAQQIVRHITTKPGSKGTAVKADDIIAGAIRATALPTRVPVALLTGGFSLTTSDRFACTAPIVDSYAPVDHWQWMATLWRGIVGPDLVIYVKTATEDEISKCGSVEFKAPGIMVIRGADKMLDEKVERRLAFELMEWVRGGSFKEGLGMN